ncbi:MAG: DUF2088 domain-containing protein [Lentisphaeraceae bacterium]|nr:DUF2088 domain-containing protein [Lentisphaeraceae bacterium]
MPFLCDGNPTRIITDRELEQHLDNYIDAHRDVKKLLFLPPDITRLNSRAGQITAYLYKHFSQFAEIKLMPALGTHFPMTKKECDKMFGPEIPFELFLPHDWKDDLIQLGQLSGEYISELSEGKLDYTMDVAVNKELFNGNYDLIVSIGQIVPHEVIGMANYTKNVLVGVGGSDTINKSHFLGAVYGMERIMGETDSPVRSALNRGYDDFIRGKLPVDFFLTVIGKENDELVMRGLYIGDDQETYEQACDLSKEANLITLDKPIKKAVVYLDPEEFKSTWLGNKAVYRTRMAMADDGELIVLAPALHTFGEDKEIDRLIRKYGYFGTDQTLKDVKENEELANNLSAAAHLIHGTSDGRFNITYCPGNEVTQQEIESVGYKYDTYENAAAKYKLDELKDGWNVINGEEIFYVSNPALGLWKGPSK